MTMVQSSKSGGNAVAAGNYQKLCRALYPQASKTKWTSQPMLGVMMLHVPFEYI